MLKINIALWDNQAHQLLRFMIMTIMDIQGYALTLGHAIAYY